MPSAILLTMTLVATAVANTDYCSLCGDHTMCLYPTSGASASCPTVLERGVSAADKTVILDAHNIIRQAVKSGAYSANNLPAAQTMPNLTWDDELATVAQRWADQCIDRHHDKCRNVPRFAVGQNVASSWKYPISTPGDWAADAVNRWFHDELDDFTQTNLIYTYATGPAGHLTQVIWADTTTIGCGFIAYPENHTYPSGTYTFIRRDYVCNYGPAGNWRNQAIYQAAP